MVNQTLVKQNISMGDIKGLRNDSDLSQISKVAKKIRENKKGIGINTLLNLSTSTIDTENLSVDTQVASSNQLQPIAIYIE